LLDCLLLCDLLEGALPKQEQLSVTPSHNRVTMPRQDLFDDTIDAGKRIFENLLRQSKVCKRRANIDGNPSRGRVPCHSLRAWSMCQNRCRKEVAESLHVPIATARMKAATGFSSYRLCI
jgi:hypothetical protein